MFVVLHNSLTIHQHDLESCRVLVRLFERSVVLHLGWIEHNQISSKTFPDFASSLELESDGWKLRELSNVFLNLKIFLFASVPGKKTGGVTIAARVRHSAFINTYSTIGGEHREGVFH